MKSVFKLMIILTCVLYGIITAQPDQTYIKTRKFKSIVQNKSVREDLKKYASTTMDHDEMMRDALKTGNLKRMHHSERTEGALKWISEDDNRVVLDVVFEKILINGDEIEPYVANISIDREKSTVKVSIQEDLVEKKTIGPYTRAIILLDDLMLLNQEDEIKLEENDFYFYREKIKTAIFEKRPWELSRLMGSPTDKTKATLTTREDGQLIASLNDSSCSRSHLYTRQYEYSLMSHMATKATFVRINRIMPRDDERDLTKIEIVKKYMNSEHWDDILGTRTIRIVEVK